MDQYLCMAFAQLTFRESLRDIEACLRSQTERLYHMGIRGQISPQHPGQCERHAKPAHLRRVRSAPDPYCSQAVCRGALRGRFGEHRLRAGLDDDRSVVVAVPMGAVSLDQGGGRPGDLEISFRTAWQSPHRAARLLRRPESRHGQILESRRVAADHPALPAFSILEVRLREWAECAIRVECYRSGVASSPYSILHRAGTPVEDPTHPVQCGRPEFPRQGPPALGAWFRIFRIADPGG